MRVFDHRTTHRNFLSLIQRFLTIVKRYGLSSNKMESNLRHYVEIMQHYGTTATFPITAKVLNRHSEKIQKFRNSNVEFAAHGYKHIDHTQLTHKELSEYLRNSIKIFQENEIPLSGFRFPYLKWDFNCFHLLQRSSFKWDSSRTILWEVLENMKFTKNNWLDYQNMLDQYNYKNPSSHICLPRFHNDLLEIPVCLPDDDLLERLGIDEKSVLSKIWREILKKTHSRGELFTLQLHPERILIFKEALESIIQMAKELYPRVWITSLDNIYRWWKEKNEATVHLRNKGDHEYEINVNCSPRTTFLFKSPYLKQGSFLKDCQIIMQRNLILRSERKPIIGVSKKCSSGLTDFLKNEGFILERSDGDGNYAIYLDNFINFSEDDETKVLKEIDDSNSPLIRFWRWPDGCKSALSITGDIDAMSIYDFIARWNKQIA